MGLQEKVREMNEFTDRTNKVLELLKSWESSYISPSAQIVIRDAMALIKDQAAHIEELSSQIETRKQKKEKNKNDH